MPRKLPVNTLIDTGTPAVRWSTPRGIEEIMLEANNPEIDVDALMQRIQERVQQRQAALPPEDGAPVLPGRASVASSAMEQLLSRAREVASVGADLPAMTRTHGVTRFVARPIAKAFLRIAQLITRDQRTFNLAALDALRVLQDGTSQTRAQLLAEIAQREEFSRKLSEFETGKLSALETALSQLRFAHEESARTQREQGNKTADLRTSMALQERRISLLL